jgi:hypothetical protein
MEERASASWLRQAGWRAAGREAVVGACFSSTSEVQFETETQSQLVQFVGHRGKKGLSEKYSANVFF